MTAKQRDRWDRTVSVTQDGLSAGVSGDVVLAVDARLRALEAFGALVAEYATYEDLGEPLTCERCRPVEPEAFEDLRRRLHVAIKELGLEGLPSRDATRAMDFL